MLPKELFLSTLEKIQKQEARIDEFNTALSKICDGFPVFDSENQYLIALRELLKYTMQDQYDYIGWWLYEAPDAGYTVWWDDEDGKEIRVDLTEPGALYDYLVEYAAPEGVQEDELCKTHSMAFRAQDSIKCNGSPKKSPNSRKRSQQSEQNVSE